MSKNNEAPKNLGIIADGNGRWALAHGLSRTEGHTKGMENILSVLDYVFDFGTENVVCYALSTENFNRPKDEIEHILQFVFEYFNAFLDVCVKNKICAKFIGQLQKLPLPVQQSLKKTEELTSRFEGEKRTIYLALAYGGRDDIVNAINEAIKQGTTVIEESFLKTLRFPFELDLIIRTGGDKRLSNFCLYQASYAELYFSEKYFPDFSKEDLVEIYEWYGGRNRRFGRVGDK